MSSLEKQTLVHPVSQSVRSISIYKNPQPNEYKILPDFSIAMGIQFQGRISIYKQNEFQLLNLSGLTGIHDRYRIFRSDKETSSLLIYFHPFGIRNFLNIPVSELTNQSVSLSDLFPKAKVQELEEKICLQNSDEERKTIFLQWLRSLWKFQEKEKAIEALLAIVQKKNGDCNVSSLASLIGISERQLERKCKEVIGISPKQYFSLYRFRKSLELYRSFPRLTDLAQEAGYFDQSHFYKYFESYTGEKPSQFFKKP